MLHRGIRQVTRNPSSLARRCSAGRPTAVSAVARQGFITMKVAVKGDPETQKLGDCPFCHRVLLTLEAKGVPHEKLYIDFDHKPDWLVEKAGGKVPALIEGEQVTADSDVIVNLLEERYPEPSMKSDVPAEVGGKLFPAFRGLLMAEGDEEELATKSAALHEQLQIIDGYLAGKGPLLGGDKLNASDASLAPKLHHTVVALGHFRGWKLPEDLKNVEQYYSALKSRPEWAASAYGDDVLVAGWEKHGAKKLVA